MIPASEDITHRMPVWDALSSLFLDTDISLTRKWRAKLLAESPYPIEELESILVSEVAPICSWNQLSIAGEWAGFDPVWLRQRILSYLRRPHWLRFGYLHRIMLFSTEWKKTRAAIILDRESLRRA